MILKDLKIDLPKNWREISRVGSENSVGIKIYHISPLSKVDPKITQYQSLPSSNPNVTITRVGVPRAGSQPIKDFYEGMKGAISSGFMPPEWTMQKLDNLHKQMTEAHYPEDGDFSADIEIAQLKTEEVARQQFKNIALMPTQGFDVPIPGGVKIPGLPENATFSELLGSDIYENMPEYLEKNLGEAKKHLSKEELKRAEEQIKKMKSISKEQWKKIRTETEKVQKQIKEELRSSLAKAGVKYKEGKYLGYKVIYAESKNPTPPPRPKSSSNAKNIPGGSGGFDDRFDPLPKFFQPYLEKIVMHQAMLVKNFVITGSLLWIIASLPPGNTPCYSLTRSKKKTAITREGGEVFKDIAIVPVVSNYAAESYLHKEEVEKIIKNLIAALK